MMLCVEAPEVYQLPRAVRLLQPETVSDSCGSEGSPRMSHSLSEPTLESLIKVRVTICEKYLFVLTSQVLHVYSNVNSCVHLGRFTLSDEMYMRFGAFRDIVFIPGWRNFCLLMEKQKRVLLCTYDMSNQNVDALPDTELQRQLSISNYGSPRREMSPSSSVHSYSLSPVRAHTKGAYEHVNRRRIKRPDAVTIKHMKLQYEWLLEPVEIRILHVLSLPASISTITCHDSQLYFWTADPPGVYVTLCPEGFTNYLGCNIYDNVPTRINLNLHATNLVSNLTVSGTVSLSKGLCYLSFKDKLCTHPIKGETNEPELYVIGNNAETNITCVNDWIKYCCSKDTSGLSRQNCDGSDINKDANPLSSETADSELPERKKLDEILTSMRIAHVIMIPKINFCLFTTCSGALVSLNISESPNKGIAQVILKHGVCKVESDGKIVVVYAENHLTLFSCSHGIFKPLWKYKLRNTRSITIHENTIAALYNHDGFICFNTMGKILLHRRSRIDDATYQSSCFAAKGLAIIATRVSKLIIYRLHSSYNLKVSYSNALNNIIAFGGVDHVLLFYARMAEGTFGVPSKPISEDRHVHSYDNSQLIGDMDCELFMLPLNALESKDGRSSLSHVSPSPNGRYLIGTLPNGRAIYDGDWKWFQDSYFDCVSMGWLNDDICFFFVTVPMRFLLANGNSSNLETPEREILSLGDSGASYCHFFRAPDLEENIALLPLKEVPLCCHVFEEVLYIVDQTQKVTGYKLHENQGNYKLNIVFQVKPDKVIDGIIKEIHFLDKDLFVLLSDIRGLYRVENGICTEILEACSHVSSTVIIENSQPSVALLCSVRFHDQLTVITSKQQMTIQAHLPAILLVNDGVVSYLINLMDPDNNVQKIRIGKMPFPCNETDQAIKGTFHMDALDKILSTVTEDKKAKTKDLDSKCKRLPKEIKWRLIARQSRKRNMKEEVQELERLFQCSMTEIFEKMLQCGRAPEASFMLLALQSITDPIHVRKNYNLRLLEMLSKEIATSMTDDSAVHLFQALLRFHHIVEEIDHVDIKSIALALLRNCDLLGVYKLCKMLAVELEEIIHSMNEEIKQIYVWGICQLEGEDCDDTGVINDVKPTTMDVFNIIIALRMQLGIFGDAAQAEVRNVRTSARTDACMSLGILESRVTLHYNWPAICSRYLSILAAEGLFVPAFAIALATANFVAISHLVVIDAGINDIVQQLLTAKIECNKCESKVNMLRHCLLEAQKSFEI